MREIPQPLVDYPFVYWVQVCFRDLDALGHVNNAVYSTYFESARLAYYGELTGLTLKEMDIILAELTITFHAPAFFNDQLAIGVRVSSIGTKSFVMEYAAARSGETGLIASGRSVLVAYDYTAGRTIPVSDQFRAQVASRQGTKLGTTPNPE